MPVLRLAVAACALLLVTACGSATTGRSTGAAASHGNPGAGAGQSNYRVTDLTKPIAQDVTLTIDTPQSFTPTETAYPRAERAVAFEMVIDNKSDTIYRPAQLSFVATADGVSAAQVIDSTQGYTGVVGAIDEVLPNQTLRFAVAFGVPLRPCVIRVAVRPASSSTNAVPLYDGTV